MVVGIVGVGTVGSTLKKYFEEHTEHEIRCLDPHKDMHDSLEDCDAVFISVPVRPSEKGQDLSTLTEAVALAKKYTSNVFIRSTVLPGTSDSLGAISMPEFLTERRAYEDMCLYPVLVGQCDSSLLARLFPKKEFIIVKNSEAELAKFTHNCFGAVKVTYFNMIYQIAQALGLDFEAVKKAASITGFVESTHTQVPGPDGFFGYGGKCFPENIEAMQGFFHNQDMESSFFKCIRLLNYQYRMREESFFSEKVAEVHA